VSAEHIDETLHDDFHGCKIDEQENCNYDLSVSPLKKVLKDDY
jgi:hypothetical protein